MFISIGKNPQIARSTLKGSQNNNVMKNKKSYAGSTSNIIESNSFSLAGQITNKDFLNSITDDARRQIEGRAFHKTDALKA